MTIGTIQIITVTFEPYIWLFLLRKVEGLVENESFCGFLK